MKIIKQTENRLEGPETHTDANTWWVIPQGSIREQY